MKRWIFLLALLCAVPTFAPLGQATVSTTAPRNDYTGNGATATYSYTFRIFAATDLRVTTRTTAGVETTLTYPTDYTVTGVNKAAGGTITLTAGNLTSGYALTIRFDRTPRQSTDLRNQGSFFAQTHEDKFDELTRYAQQNKDVIDRSIHLPETEAGTAAATTLPASTARASKFLGWDSSGNPIAAAGTSADLGPVSSYINTLLDDTTAAAARTTLDVSQAINSLTAETAPAAGDLLPLYDASATADRKMTLSNMLKVVNDLAEDTTPDKAADFVLTYDTSASGVKKAKPDNLIPAASETVSGRVELATQAEVNTMTDTARALTPNHNKIVMSAMQASTSGTAIDFTGIPAGVRRVTVSLSGVSLDNTADWIVQIGDAGGVEASGYLGGVGHVINGASSSVALHTTGFSLTNTGAATTVGHGIGVLVLMDATTNTWAWSSSVAFSNTAVVAVAGGAKALSATLDRVRITTVGGTAAFDAGNIGLMYER